MSLQTHMVKPTSFPGIIRHYHVLASGADEPEYVPHFYVETRIDFNDVRSGLRQTCSLSNAMEIQTMDGDAIWTRDMIRAIDGDSLCPGMPAGSRMRSLPNMVDATFLSHSETQYYQYLMRYHSIRILRNSALNLYSAPNESPDDFAGRCLEAISGSLRMDLDRLSELFERKLEQIKVKYRLDPGSEEFDDSRLESRAQGSVHAISERLTELFLNTQAPSGGTFEVPSPPGIGAVEIEERLVALELEAKRAVGNLLREYHDKARSIDEYIIHPNLKDIHLVRSCILWLPNEVSVP